jgi:hypothetical protein
MEVETIVHVPCSRKPLHRELVARGLRNSLWVSLYFAQELRLHGLEHRLTTTLVEVDQLLVDLDEHA